MGAAFSGAPAAGYYIRNLETGAEGGVDSPLALLKSDSLNRRELTFKALAGLCGGAIGWLPVELASHNSHLGEAQTVGRHDCLLPVGGDRGGPDRRVHHGGRYLGRSRDARSAAPIHPRLRDMRASLAAVDLRSEIMCSIWFCRRVESASVQADSCVSGSIVTLVIARLLGWAIDGALRGRGRGTRDARRWKTFPRAHWADSSAARSAGSLSI